MEPHATQDKRSPRYRGLNGVAMATTRHWPIWLAVAVGLALRLREYLACRSLWLDEVFLAGGIIDTPWYRLLIEPLPNNQVAAPLFVVLAKVATAALGPGEWAVRLIPFLAGCFSVVLFARVAGRYLSPGGAFVATLLFSLSDYLIYYTTDFKPYSLDVLCTVWLLGWAVAPIDRAHSLQQRLLLSVLLLGSFTSGLVLLGAGLYRLVRSTGRSAELRALAVTGACLLPAAALSWLLGARYAAANVFLYQYWHYAFPTIPPRTLEDLNWFVWTFRGLFEHAFDAWSYTAVGFLFIAGMVLHRHGPLLALCVLVPLAAAAAKLYPFHGRTVLFLAPVVCLAVVAALNRLGRGAIGLAAWLAAVALLTVPALVVATRYAVHPRQRAPIRLLLERLTELDLDDGDVVTNWLGGFVYDYYRKMLPLPRRRPTSLGEWNGDRATYEEAVRTALQDRPTWFVYYGVVDWRRGPVSAVYEETRALEEALGRTGEFRVLYRRPGAILYHWQPAGG